MKRTPYLFPLALLLLLFSLSLWNGHVMTVLASRLETPVRLAGQLAAEDAWEAASAALTESYQDWSGCQTYLHIVLEHDAVDDAEAMYRRAAAFAATREITEFRAEAADLCAQLQLLAEMEQCSIKNVL